MEPSHTRPLSSHAGQQRQTWSQSPTMMTSNNRRDRNEDSWIEISSQPSSSSLSSINQAPISLPSLNRDERVPRRIQIDTGLASEPPRSTSATGSSQDEYEESSSDSDPILSSSNEEIAREQNEEDDRTALGMRETETVFTPPANAFSHPPSDSRMSETYLTHENSTPSTAIRTDRYQRTRPNLQRERSSGSFQPNHDAALRASLTTLLSCAAAVKPKEQRVGERSTRPAAERTAFQLVPESHLQRQRPPKALKRRSTESSKERHAKKLKAVKIVSNEETTSPTLTAWMVSAGVVLVFSAISFSAGYAWGKEVGRLEGEIGLTGGGCGQEAMRSSGSGLRKMRWSAGNSSIRA